MHAPYSVATEDGKFLRLLTHAFGQAEPSDKLLDEAEGSGLTLLQALRRRAANASRQDKALVTAKFTSTVRNGVDGVDGDLTLASLKAFLKAYKKTRGACQIWAALSLMQRSK